eukprot:10389012-Alexandrium_andersonii.AAC.1
MALTERSTRPLSRLDLQGPPAGLSPPSCRSHGVSTLADSREAKSDSRSGGGRDVDAAPAAKAS